MRFEHSTARAVAGWLLTAVVGLGIGFGVVAGKDYYDHAQLRSDMTHQGDFRSLLASRGHPRAVMVVREGCRFCEMGRAWLGARKIAVVEVYRPKSPDVDAELTRLGLAGTPILLFPDRYVMGFDEDVWNKAFEGGVGTQGGK